MDVIHKNWGQGSIINKADATATVKFYGDGVTREVNTSELQQVING